MYLSQHLFAVDMYDDYDLAIVVTVKDSTNMIIKYCHHHYNVSYYNVTYHLSLLALTIA